MNRVKTTVAAVAATVMLGAFAIPAAATTSGEAEAAASNPAYKILKHLDYSGPGKASLRVGYYNRAEDKGFGWNKVKKKHNITKYAAVEYIAKSPNRDRVGNTTTYHMTGYAGKYNCNNGTCRLVKQYKMILSVNQKVQRDGQDKGVITMYCKGVVRCPNWVSKALAKENGRSLAAEDSVVAEEENDVVIAEEDAPDNSDAPADEVVDEGDADDENTPVDGNAPAEEGDTSDGSETYVSSYEPLAASASTATLQAARAVPTATGSEKLAAGYSPLKQTVPAAVTEDRYRYVGSYTKLR
ncbi:hypothetical protein O3Q52_38885 [Streptomyces sp. ActVer]|uniref:hypothetical protein n=1 Tax=Streptomyces sp. ActVer TaxID=3014558 RepID=UPI0022B5BFAC|nr:hypothetical protein [Streptomyces sp. ActVer]MCZ4514002.1 hypothetical protein [Streptomyces sp. ActVer]